MPTLEVFDPAMCCSTGVCGPQVDPALIQFAGSLSWLKRQGVTVSRFNLGQQAQEFVTREPICKAITSDPSVLPILLVNGEITFQGRYPSKAELAEAFGLSAPAEPISLNVVQV